METRFKFDESLNTLRGNPSLMIPSVFYLILMVASILGAITLVFFMIGLTPALIGDAAAAVSAFFTFFLLFFLGIMGYIVFIWVLEMLVFTATIDMACKAIEGKKVGFSDFTAAVKKYFFRSIAAGILVGILSMVGVLFLWIGSLIVQFFLFFVPVFMVRENLGVVESIKKSISFVRENIIDSLVIFAIYFGANMVSGMLLYIPMILAIPVVFLVAVQLVDDAEKKAVAI